MSTMPRSVDHAFLAAIGGLKIGEPVLTLADGVVHVTWPDDDAQAAIVARELIDQMAATKNELTTLRLAARYLLDGLNDCGLRPVRDMDERIAALAAAASLPA